MIIVAAKTKPAFHVLYRPYSQPAGCLQKSNMMYKGLHSRHSAILNQVLNKVFVVRTLFYFVLLAKSLIVVSKKFVFTRKSH